MKEREEFYNNLDKVTLDELPNFLEELINQPHNYDTIVYAIVAGAIATAWAMNNHKNGGITGFQAGAVMWEFIRQWSYRTNECGMRILNYDDMLFPQDAHRFEKTITDDTFSLLQKKADKKLAEYYSTPTDERFVSEQVLHHWQSISDGYVPFGYTIKEQ